MQAHRALAVLGVAAALAAARADSLLLRNDLPGTWIDATNGTPLGISGDQVADITSPIGNSVFAAGTWHVGNNGAVGFGTDATLPPVTDPIPTQQLFNGQQSAAPFADDIGNDTGDIFWKVAHGDGPGSDILVIEWHDKRFEGNADTSRFQIQIFADPGPAQIFAQFLYQDIEQPWPNGGEIATIGYQDGGAGFSDFQWSYHVAGAVSNGTVLSLVPVPELAGATLLLVVIAALRRLEFLDRFQ